MDPDTFFPIGAKLWTVLGVFAFLLIGLDLVLVRWLKLGKVAWKRVDYIWLGFAALGILSSVAQVRIIAASTLLGVYEHQATIALSSVRSLAEMYAAKPGAICRTFVRSEWSPPPDQMRQSQHEYDTACEWATEFAAALRSNLPSPIARLDPSRLPVRPEVTDGALKDMFKGMDRQLEYFNRRMDDLELVRTRARNTHIEQVMVYLWPFLLAIALALRITKVTGEIKLES